MAENYKHLYEQTKKMLTMYQDELIPGFRKQIEELESTVANQRKRADTAETFICTMCAECKWEENDGMRIMQKSCGCLFPLDCNKFKLHSLWIPVTERLPKPNRRVLCWWEAGNGEKEHYGFATFQSHGVWYVSNEGMPKVTHWMPLPEPPEEVE